MYQGRGIDRRVRDPHWFKDAVIYELRVRSYADGNGDGVGDFIGLREKLPFLQDLGVTALWLLPFYPSPGRDDGYDISDYHDVHADAGTLDDFKELLDEAHRLGLRVITELVLNHTSDQHPWFQRARRAPPGSPERNFYVWSDDPERYKEARIIFKDFEPSNWAWDPVAKQYFWHRFYAHQPDLNFENPAVQEAMLGVVDFWFGMGVDGLRLDAVPYLFEANGTNCENLPETHAFLRKLRSHVDARFPDRMLLAEANQWPEDAAAYFGRGDECHMNFHFPIMPRLFMSIHMEDRFPILDILEQTPALPESCQWALFLRNHDELTLEMVTEDERDYMYRVYAHDPTMRINLGIRRRLAPLVGNDRRKIELMNALLLSLPGTPVLYYGDEIGMGDNVYLGDRNGVRTPMQWSSDRNAGFSRANPQKLILPVIIDPEYHYEAINVEAQQDSTSSLLWFTKRLLALRRRTRAFGRGTIDFLTPDNPRTLAFVRHHEGETIVVVANLSRFVQVTELDLSRFEGLVPVEMFGRTEFPVVTRAPYMLTLAGHGFYWFSMERPRRVEQEKRPWTPRDIEIDDSARQLFVSSDLNRLESLFPDWLATRVWFNTRGRRLEGLRIVEALPIGGPHSPHLVIMRTDWAEGESEHWLVPLAVSSVQPTSGTLARLQRKNDPDAWVHEPFTDPEACPMLLYAVRAGVQQRGRSGNLVASSERPLPVGELEARLLHSDHGELLVAYDDEVMLRLYRRLGDGISPEVEVGRHVRDRIEPGTMPELRGTIAWKRGGRGEPVTLGVVRSWMRAEGDAAIYTHGELGRFFERALSEKEPPPPLPDGNLVSLVSEVPPERVLALVGPYLDVAPHMARSVAKLHLALAAPTDDPAFAPQPYSALDRRSVYQSMRNLLGTTLRTLRSSLRKLPPDSIDAAQRVLEAQDRLYQHIELFLQSRLTALRTRHHGHLDLTHLLHTGRDFTIISFDGDRARPLAERRRKRSPLRDVASMLGSIHATSRGALCDEGLVREADRERLEPWARHWVAWSSAAFLRGYLETLRGAEFLPHTRDELSMLLDRLVLEAQLRALSRYLARGSDLVRVPLDALDELLRVK